MNFRSLTRSIHAFFLAAGLLALATGCATTSQTTHFDAAAIVKINPATEPREARREAIHGAEIIARQKLKTEAYALRLTDGRELENLAILDPFVRAVVDDTVRRARIVDQTESDEGIVTLTLRMELDPLYKMLSDYSKHPI